jgi:hypothetical protein
VPTNTSEQLNPTARFEEVLARAGARDRATIERHLTACETESTPDHAKLWRRLAGTLGALAPLPVRLFGAQAVVFFVPDGKYRMQVFALEDRRDGQILIYLPDILAQAVREKILIKNGSQYNVGPSGKRVLNIESVDAANTTDPPPHVKDMIGWNRKALRITLSTVETDGQLITAAEAICNLAAKRWVDKVEKAEK